MWRQQIGERKPIIQPEAVIDSNDEEENAKL
jgi:hypothetical protein